VVQWVLGSLAAQRVYRVHFSVQSEADGEDGTVAYYFPRRSLRAEPPPEADGRRLVVRIADTPSVEHLAELHARIRTASAADSAAVRAASWAEVDATGLIPAGSVLRVGDVLLRSGVPVVFFRGADLPPESQEAAAIDALRAREKERASTGAISLDGVAVSVRGGAAEALPPRARVVQRFVGSFPALRGGWEFIDDEGVGGAR
jgi:hypothetical protein